MSDPSSATDGAPPLYVDLEGALSRSSLVSESAVALLRNRPLSVFSFPFWLAAGRRRFRREVVQRAQIDPGLLLYRQDLLEFLQGEHAKGRELVLVSSLEGDLPEAVARHLGLFSRVETEAGALRRSWPSRLAEGTEGLFAYAGPGVSTAGPEVAGTNVVVVQVSGRTEGDVEAVFHLERQPGLRTYLRAIRIHQWLKNVLVFVPPVMAHRGLDVPVMASAALGFLGFSLCATSAYVLNDLIDLPSDRRHRTKRDRPFASGALPIARGVALIPVLLAGALTFALLLPPRFLVTLALYLATTLAYSFRLKRAALVDVLVLAGLYTLRILGGGAATSTPVSFWLLAFSMFLFLSLGLVKRYAELTALAEVGGGRAEGRGYHAVDLESLAQFGSASGYMSVLVLALYINSNAVLTLYSRPEIIWLLCPLLLYLISRIWLLARRGVVDEDPVVFLLEDGRSQLILLSGAVLLTLAV